MNMEKKLSVEIPRTPNFIRVGSQVISIDGFSEEELREIGKEWTEKLILSAHKKAQHKHAIEHGKDK